MCPEFFNRRERAEDIIIVMQRGYGYQHHTHLETGKGLMAVRVFNNTT